jgi:hypothetical protein
MVSIQKSTIAVQPPQRCDCSNALWALTRTGEAAHMVTTRSRATRATLITRVVSVTLPECRARDAIAVPLKAHSHNVPQSAPPA